jgi:hypothetical protein
MGSAKKTKADELTEYSISLTYLAQYTGRSYGYVRLWSCGAENSKLLDDAATFLIEARQRELQAAPAL